LVSTITSFPINEIALRVLMPYNNIFVQSVKIKLNKTNEIWNA